MLFSSAIILSASILPARAAEGVKYAMALTDNVYFYDEMESNTELFALPCTYCVQIKWEYEEWYRVVYAKDDGLYDEIEGYCKKENLMVLREPPENSYLSYPVDVVLNSGEDKKLPGLQLTVTAAFYGNFRRAGTPYICLRYNGEFGYIEGEINDYIRNDIPSAPTFSDGVSADTDAPSTFVPVLVIVALAAAAVIVLIVTGRKNHKRQ